LCAVLCNTIAFPPWCANVSNILHYMFPSFRSLVPISCLYWHVIGFSSYLHRYLLVFLYLGFCWFFFVLPLLGKLSHFSHSFPFFPVFLDHHLQGGWGAHQGGHRLHVVIVVLLLAVPFDPALDRFLQEGSGSEAQIFQWRLYLFYIVTVVKFCLY